MNLYYIRNLGVYILRNFDKLKIKIQEIKEFPEKTCKFNYPFDFINSNCKFDHYYWRVLIQIEMGPVSDSFDFFQMHLFLQVKEMDILIY